MNLKQNFKYMSQKHKISKRVDKFTIAVEQFNAMLSIIEKANRKKIVRIQSI